MSFYSGSRPSADELDSLPTLAQGYTSDLKWENGQDLRFWLHRTRLADGEQYERTVTVEAYDYGEERWYDLAVYDGETGEED